MPARVWPVAIIGIVVAALLFLLWLSGISLVDVETSRFLLMIMIVSATIYFAFTLISASLDMTKTDEENQIFEKRFQKGREVFLVFSGVFATVVGFYFGSVKERVGASAVGIGASLAPGGAISAMINGGVPPYRVNFVSGGTTLPLAQDANDASKFTLAVSDKACPNTGSIEVTNTNGLAYPSVAITLSKEELRRAGWVACTPDSKGAIIQPTAEPVPAGVRSLAPTSTGT